MLLNRVLVTVILLPIGIAAILLGGWFYALMVAFFLGMAGWEYANLFRAGGLQPARILVVGGVLILALSRQQGDSLENSSWWLGWLTLLAMSYHLLRYESGRDQSASDLGITLMGLLYLGWIGGYMISLRALPDGEWWVLLVLPSVWVADSVAYLVGNRFGRHQLTRRLSPKKTWEGYMGGIVGGVLSGILFCWLWVRFGAPSQMFTLERGALVGLVMGIFPTLGDLGESMIKRQVGVKDSGNLLPGHGGFFDRIDSWLWAAILGYYLITWLWV